MSMHAKQVSGKSGQNSSESATASRTIKDVKSVRSTANAQRIPAWAMALGDRLPPGLMLQTKLTVNQPGDPYEQEADRVAEQVMRTTDLRTSVSDDQDQAKNSLLLGHDFSRIPIHPPAAAAIQTKLAINKPGDEYEQEVERVSEQVMRMPEPQLQRACTCGGACPKCQMEQLGQEDVRLQTEHLQASDAGETAVPPIVHEVIHSPGQPLDPVARAFMEQRFGHDFSRVRVHADESAEMSVRAINAHAYTVGNDIVFGHGHFDFNGTEGRRLLAHELTHVVQQSARHAPGTAARQPMEAGLLQRKDEAKAPPKTPRCFTGCAQRWGKNTICSRWGFQLGVHEREPQSIIEVKGKKLKLRPCCNSWPWSLEDYARRHLGLEGAASCPAQFGQEIATITTLDGNEAQVLCSDTIDPAKVLTKKIDQDACTDAKFKADGGELIEMSPKAMLKLSGSTNNRLPVTVCFSGSKQDLCSHDGPGPKRRTGRDSHPEVGDCLTEGCTPPKDTPKLEDTGWPP